MSVLDGKVAIVTGAARGLGRVEALELARQGARVVVSDLGTTGDGSGGSGSTAGCLRPSFRVANGIATRAVRRRRFGLLSSGGHAHRSRTAEARAAEKCGESRRVWNEGAARSPQDGPRLGVVHCFARARSRS